MIINRVSSVMLSVFIIHCHCEYIYQVGYSSNDCGSFTQYLYFNEGECTKFPNGVTNPELKESCYNDGQAKDSLACLGANNYMYVMAKSGSMRSYSDTLCLGFSSTLNYCAKSPPDGRENRKFGFKSSEITSAKLLNCEKGSCQCSSGTKIRITPVTKPNGCGDSKLLSLIANFLTPHLRDSCNFHDNCWEFGEDKDTCDKVFYLMMVKKCESLFSLDQCFKQASIYYSLVSLNTNYYHELQLKNFRCLELSRTTIDGETIVFENGTVSINNRVYLIDTDMSAYNNQNYTNIILNTVILTNNVPIISGSSNLSPSVLILIILLTVNSCT